MTKGLSDLDDQDADAFFQPMVTCKSLNGHEQASAKVRFRVTSHAADH